MTSELIEAIISKWLYGLVYCFYLMRRDDPERRNGNIADIKIGIGTRVAGSTFLGSTAYDNKKIRCDANRRRVTHNIVP
jgi:hypothetical protein